MPRFPTIFTSKIFKLASTFLICKRLKNPQVNLVDWLKTMVSNRNSEGVLDPKLPDKPSSRALKRTLLVALRCVDPNSQKRPKMGHVVHMLEADDFPFRDVSLDYAYIRY